MSTTPRTDDIADAWKRRACGSDYVIRKMGELETELTACTTRLAEVERERDEARQLTDQIESEKFKLRDTLAADNARLKAELGQQLQSVDTSAQDAIDCVPASGNEATTKEYDRLIDAVKNGKEFSEVGATQPLLPATPETEEALRLLDERGEFSIFEVVDVSFARTLERQRNAALRDRDELKRRVEELEKAYISKESELGFAAAKLVVFTERIGQLGKQIASVDSLRAELATLKAEVVRKDAALRAILKQIGHEKWPSPAMLQDGESALSPTAPKEDGKV